MTQGKVGFMTLRFFVPPCDPPVPFTGYFPSLFYHCVCNIDDRKQSTGIVKIISPHYGYRSERNAMTTPFMPGAGSDKNILS